MKANSEKITRDFCRGKKLAFFPETRDEAVFIQKTVFSFGFKWRDGDTHVAEIENSVAKGIGLSDGTMHYFKDAPDLGGYLICRATQLDENYLPPEQMRLIEVFSRLMARIDGLEAKIDRISKEISPREIDKPLPRGLTKGDGRKP
jgi:hypothetical protein